MKQNAKNYDFQSGHAVINRFYHAKSKNDLKIKFTCANVLYFAHIFAILQALAFPYE